MPTYIKDLDPDTPPRVSLAEAESTATWDDEIRAVKEAYQNEFSNIDGAVTVTQKELNSTIDRIERAGDQMTDQLIAAADPVDDYDLVTKQWVEALFQVPPTNPGDDYAYGYIDLVEIPQSPLVFGALYTQANTLTDTPSKWIVKLVCIEGEYGYEAGDEVHVIGPQSDDTDNNLKVGGIQPFSNSTEVGLQVGAAVFILDRSPEYPGRFREVTPSRWELTGQAIQIGELATVQPCTPGVQRWTLDALRGQDRQSFIDRTNNKYLMWYMGGSTNKETALYVWDMSTDSLSDLLTHYGNINTNVNNRSSGFGYSENGDGVIDRYVHAYRASGTSTSMTVYVLRASDLVRMRYNNSYSGDLGAYFFCETLQWVCYQFGGEYINAWQKSDTASPFTITSIFRDVIDTPGYDLYSHSLVNMPDRTYCLMVLTDASGVYSLANFTPGLPRGTVGTKYEITGYNKSPWVIQGSVYDGTNVWILFYSSLDPRMLKFSPNGQLLASYAIGTGETIADASSDYECLDYDPHSGYIVMFWGDQKVRFFDRSTGSIVKTETINSSDTKQKYYGPGCAVYTIQDYDPGTGDEITAIKDCIICA